MALGKRTDLRDLPLVTIDGEDARDFDDAVHAEPDGDGWKVTVAIADVAHYVKPGSALDRLRVATAAQLGDGEFTFQLLLGEPALPLRERAQALFDWCRSFLGGFGLASGKRPALSEEGEEALQDLARLAQATTLERRQHAMYKGGRSY